MEERHKKILQRNRTNLVSDLDPSNLYDGLLEKGVFTQDMIDEIKVRQLSFRLILCCLWDATLNHTPVPVSAVRALGPGVTRPDS